MSKLLDALAHSNPTEEISRISRNDQADREMEAVENAHISRLSRNSRQNQEVQGLRDTHEDGLSIHDSVGRARSIPLNDREIRENRENVDISTASISRSEVENREIREKSDASIGYVKRKPSEWRALYAERLAALRVEEADEAYAVYRAFMDCFDQLPKDIWPADRVDLLVRAGIPKPDNIFIGEPRRKG